jgi:proline dehydrogenase
MHAAGRRLIVADAFVRQNNHNIIALRRLLPASVLGRAAASSSEVGVALLSSSATPPPSTVIENPNNVSTKHCLKSSSSESHPLSKPPQLQKPAIDFDSSASAHGTKTTVELLRAIIVFEACLRLPSLVKHADNLLALSNKLLGKTVTKTIVKYTFFRHFCAGENSVDMKPVIEKLKQCNIGAILDYAAESDNDTIEGAENDGNAASSSSSSSSMGHDIVVQPPFNQPARIYDYKSESECDHHVSIFKECIRSVRNVSNDVSTSSVTGGGGGGGFAALKVTALGNPKLLELMSTMIIEVKNLFSKFDEDGNGLVSREDFVRCYG